MLTIVIKLRSIWNQLKSSFWFLPTLTILMTIGGAALTIYLDTIFDFKPTGVIQYILPSSVNSARSVLSTISGAMIGVAGTVFSITLVALTLASSQFGSRLLRNFMHDRTNQIVLGAYVSTFVYCLFVLNAVNDNDGIEFIPGISILIAISAAVINIFLLIVFIHHISMSIQADNVISDVSSSLSKNLESLFPEIIGEDTGQNKEADPDLFKIAFGQRNFVTSSKNGYLEYVDYDNIFNIAKEHDSLIKLMFRPGDHLVSGSITMEIISEDDIPNEVIKKLQDLLIIGKVRTPYQDAEFSINQMVEIAARALSPGINDPYTAIACIDNLTSTLCQLTQVKFPSSYRYDEDGVLRVIADVLTFEGMLGTAFNQIRQFSGGSPAVVIRLMEAMVTINHFVRTDEQRKCVKKHVGMILRLAESSFKEKNDISDLKERSKLILAP
ncbi:MAG: DUF2254 domain-containing protein [Methanomassiliicoccales archaeon]|nr:DUF2254 domain-containing protein [Methanomassiliicoccales archaeon]